ncbi:MAG: penicillin-binding protein 2 [Candidatus Aminicenantes bacterium]|nr:penicillin-binding protein 2 [Candidatus Aminicenantes bacterium]
MTMKINYQGKKRFFFLSIIFFVWIFFIAFKLFKLQVIDFNTYLAKVKAQTNRVEDLHSKRGTITDRHGEILAISLQSKSAFLSNKDKEISLAVFRDFCRLLALDNSQKIKVNKRIRRGEKFIWLKRKLTDEEYQKILPLASSKQTAGTIDFIDEYRRVYPQKKMAAHILGGVGMDEQALGGIETSLDSEIKGRGGKIKVLIDARKKIFQFKYLEMPVAGKDIHLSIDAALQFLVERELVETVRKYRAAGGAVIVLRSTDAQILAMASYPDYYPQMIWRAPSQALKNKAISFLYDPGSTFKIVLAAAALENHSSAPGEMFNCHQGVYMIKDRRITDVHPFDRLSFEDIIIQSSNIGAAGIGQRLGKEKYFHSIQAFGFGRRTGIMLPAEENGILNSPEKWSGVSLVYLSHGYEISVTPLQMAAAFNVLASGGYWLQPQILLEPGPESEKRKILSLSSQQPLTAILTAVVDRGTGKKARIAGIEIAGKTGTARKVKAGKYASSYVSSFGGFFPAGDPQVTVFVMIDEPLGLYYGGDVAAPLFKSVAAKIMPYLRLFPDRPDQKEIYL